jgi:hypothetical protein
LGHMKGVVECGILSDASETFPAHQIRANFKADQEQAMSPSFGVSSKEIQKARRIAKRIRASVACAGCRYKKAKCSEFRPCKICVSAGTACKDSSGAVNTKTTSHYSSRHNDPADFNTPGYVHSQDKSLDEARPRTISTDHRPPPKFQSVQMIRSDQPALFSRMQHQYAPPLVDYVAFRSAPIASNFSLPSVMMNSTPLFQHMLPTTTSSLPPLPSANTIPPSIAALLLQASTPAPPSLLPPALQLLLALSTPPPAFRL